MAYTENFSMIALEEILSEWLIKSHIVAWQISRFESI